MFSCGHVSERHWPKQAIQHEEVVNKARETETDRQTEYITVKALHCMQSAPIFPQTPYMVPQAPLRMIPEHDQVSPERNCIWLESEQSNTPKLGTSRFPGCITVFKSSEE